MSVQKSQSAKQAWGELSERARLGEHFGFIGALALAYSGNLISKKQVVELLNERGITREDLRKYEKHRKL